ncbi:MAG: hypothetical protein HY850_02030 [Betaproteobacteria bacterium]|nr:hypothetical protein [Betaproteobacteria bacterium]
MARANLRGDYRQCDPGPFNPLLELGRSRRVVLLNSLSSFSAERERAGEFGDYILEVSVPLAKVFFFQQLLPGMPKGEDEYAVIGGVYEVGYSTL